MKKNGKFTKRGVATKVMVMILSLVLVAGLSIGGTLAWLSAKADPVTNTFSTSTIGVKLEEGKDLDLTMIPGWTITKDPKAWITEGSEDAYLFVKVEKSENFDDFMTYEIADGWTELELEDGVYYREVLAEQQGEAAAILKNNQVVVEEDVTKEMMSGDGFKEPTLKFTAYGFQLYKNSTDKFTAAEAWGNLTA